MKYKNIEYNGKKLKRINSRKLNNIINDYKNNLGLVIYTLPINANPTCEWLKFFEIEINEHMDTTDYVTTINEIQFYNCVENLGNYLKFYIEIK